MQVSKQQCLVAVVALYGKGVCAATSSSALYPDLLCAAGIHWTESRKLLEAAIATEQQFPRTDPVDYRHDVVAQEQRLNSRLYSLGLEMCVQKGDGNCQFRSLSWGLYGTPRHHAYVRKTCCDYMGRCRAEFEAFLGEDFRAYVKAMARDGVWGDELTLVS